MQIAQSLDPVSAIIARDLTMVHYYRRDFEAALDQCDHTIELNPHFSPAYWTLGLIQEQRKDFDESAAAFQRAVHLSPHSPRMHGALGRTFALSGKRKMALGILRKLRDLAKRRYVSPFEFASIHFALGQADVGFRWLTQARQDRAFELTAIKVDPRFDLLKEDRRFAELAREIGLE
jgi:serine/threonine-protein kinase